MNLKVMKAFCVIRAVPLALFIGSTAYAQSPAPISSFSTPSYRGQGSSESAFWNDTTNAVYGAFTNANGVNQGVYSAPGGLSLANASISQTTPGAFIIPKTDPNSGDIYSFSSTNTFVLNYSLSNPGGFPDGVGSVVFQAETFGVELAYESVLLSYGTNSLSATRSELYRATGTFMGFPVADVLSKWEWTLPDGADVANFSITFNASGTSLALERVMLDVAAVPEPNTIVLVAAGLALVGLRLSRRNGAH